MGETFSITRVLTVSNEPWFSATCAPPGRRGATAACSESPHACSTTCGSCRLPRRLPGMEIVGCKSGKTCPSLSHFHHRRLPSDRLLASFRAGGTDLPAPASVASALRAGIFALSSRVVTGGCTSCRGAAYLPSSHLAMALRCTSSGPSAKRSVPVSAYA